MAPALAPAALFGLLIGSFLNVVAWRLPRGESLVKPRSKCPGCATQLKAYDNIPVFSWLALRGRCRGCGEKISARYPVVEAVTAALYVLVVALKWGDVLQMTLGLVLVTFLVPIAVIDLDLKIIPNKLTAPAAVLAARPRRRARAVLPARAARRRRRCPHLLPAAHPDPPEGHGDGRRQARRRPRAVPRARRRARDLHRA